MKKRIILKSAAFASAAVLSPLLLNVSELGGLKDVAQPYLGTYECEQIFFGGEERTDDFDYLRIELRPKGELKLFCKEKDGHKWEKEAKYSYDAETNKLTILPTSAEWKRRRNFLWKRAE